MKKKQKFLKPSFAFLLFFTFSMLVIGCGDKNTTKANTEKTESKQLMEKNSLNVNEADVAAISESVPLSINPTFDDEIHPEEWMQLVEDIKSTLNKIEADKQALQSRKPR